jgi:hypothetical protein
MSLKSGKLRTGIYNRGRTDPHDRKYDRITKLPLLQAEIESVQRGPKPSLPANETRTALLKNDTARAVFYISQDAFTSSEARGLNSLEQCQLAKDGYSGRSAQ